CAQHGCYRPAPLHVLSTRTTNACQNVERGGAITSVLRTGIQPRCGSRRGPRMRITTTPADRSAGGPGSRAWPCNLAPTCGATRALPPAVEIGGLRGVHY